MTGGREYQSMSRFPVAVAAPFGLVILVAVAWAADPGPAVTSQWRGPNRDGTFPQAALATDWTSHPPRQVWKANVGIGFTGVAVAGGLACTAGNRDETDTWYAFDAATGAVKWTYAYPCELADLRHEGGPYATPAVEDGRLYAFSKTGVAFCLDAGTGKAMWKTDVVEVTGTERPRYGYSSSPLIHGRLLILNVGPAGVAFDKATGRLVWRSSGSHRPGHASPMLVPGERGRKLLILAESQLSLVDPATGRVLTAQTLPAGDRPYKIADPLLVGEGIFITASYDNFCALFEIGSGGIRKVWENTNLISKVLNPVLIGDHVIGGYKERSFRCISAATGELKWEERFAGNPILVGRQCLILTTEGELVLADVSPTAYKELARQKVIGGKCWTPPTFAGGRLYCRNATGDVVCVDPAGT